MYTFHGINNYDYDHKTFNTIPFHESPMYHQNSIAFYNAVRYPNFPIRREIL